MTTVADLVAKLGFQVDTRGFDNFKKSLQAFQSIVRDGIKDLKEYAKQAERISKAFKEAYLPSQKEASARYRAETYAIKARAYAQRVRAKWLPYQLSIRDRNASVRERQTLLKENGISGGRGVSGGGALLSILGMLSGGIGGVISGGLTALGSAIGGPVGAAVALAISKLMGSLIRGLVSGLHWLWGQIKQGLAYAMAFRDYRAFTGRNTSGLNNLMGMTKWATNLTPQDIMKDATAMGQQYWDMWFGGGNPAVWQLLGLTPTMNGETNLKNILGRIFSVTGGGKNRGLALNLLKQFGLSEDYMNILDHWEDYKAGGGEKSFAGYSEEQIARMEEANKSLREFSIALDQVRVYFVDALLKSGLKDALKDIADYLLGLIHAFKSGKIHDMSSLTRHLFAFDRMTASGASGRYVSRSEFRELTDKMMDKLKKEQVDKLLSGQEIPSRDIFEQMAKEAIIADMRKQSSQTIYNNQFNMQGQPLAESVPAANNIIEGQNAQNLFNGSVTMVPTYSQ